jgi:iron complex outermembrane recepter protein
VNDILPFTDLFGNSSERVLKRNNGTVILWHHSTFKFYVMKKSLTLAVCLFFNLGLFSQTFSVKGLVKNDNNEAVPFATVAVYKAQDTTLVKADIADSNGGFKISNIPIGKFFLIINSIGFQKSTSPAFDVTDKDVDLPPSVLKAETRELKEFVVKTSKPMVEVLADKTVFNVQSSLSATGTTGFELLRKAPGVIIDNSESIILEGKTGVLIYIDGKPSVLTGQDLTNFLKTLQASDIEAIEIITQPSSKYDAAGNAGILNIRLKKDKRFGTNGTVALGTEYGINGRYNSSISLNNRNRKTNFFANYSNRFGKTRSFMDMYRQQNGVVYDLKTVNVNDALSHNVKTGVDVFINNKSTLGVILNGNFNNGNTINNSRTPITRMSENAPNQVLVAQSLSEYASRNIYLNTNYRFADTLGHVLNMDADYGFYDSKRLNDQPNTYYNGNETAKLFERIYQMNTPTNISVLTFKADYEQNFLNGKLAIGFKLSHVKTDNTFNFFDVINGEKTINQDLSNKFVYSENINAGYINYNKTWGKLNFQGGLRIEHTVSDGNLTSTQVNKDSRVPRNYVNLFPSGGFTYALNANNALGLTYSRRIERPNYRSLNPFEWKTDELSYSKGNAFLKPQYSDDIKLSNTYKYTLTTSISYSYIQDFFAQITDTIEGTRNFIMEQNIANQRVINIGISYPFQVAKWWDVFISIDAYRSSFEATNEKYVPITRTTASFYGQNTFSLPRQWKMEISGWFSTPAVWGGTYLTKTLGSLDIAFQKKIFNDKISARLAFSDVFFTSYWRGDTQFGDLKISGKGGWESQQVRLNLSYNFGNNQVKSARNRKTGLEDEKGRIN